MNKPVHIKTPGGEDIVILPASEYRRLAALAEDNLDLAVAERALAAFDSSKTDVLNETEMLELLEHPSPVGFWRRRRNLTQAALGEQTGITQAYLAQIEKGKRTGNIKVYRRLSDALHVDLVSLLPDLSLSAPVTKKRRGSPRTKR